VTAFRQLFFEVLAKKGVMTWWTLALSHLGHFGRAAS
jgi:hypothetical protein